MLKKLLAGKSNLAVYVVLVIMTVVVFTPVLQSDFINYDDTDYVTENLFVRSGVNLHSIKWAFTTTLHDHWHPLTWFSHMLDCQLFGLNPKAHHATNLILHLLNVLLLFHILFKLTASRWRSAFVAVLFALHPLHVESVAWIASRKDLLSTFFMFLTIWAYIDYVKNRKRSFYLLSLIFFIAGLLAKSMLVTLPAVLLLLDFWPLERLKIPVFGRQSKSKEPLNDMNVGSKHVWLEKIPFLAFSFIDAAIVYLAHQHRLTESTYKMKPLAIRFVQAVNAYAMYVYKMFCPVKLGIAYRDIMVFPLWQTSAAVLLLTVITAVCIFQCYRRPYLFVGWFWYLGTLFPVSGIIKTGPRIMADRYTYIPLIGLFIVVVWVGNELYQQFPRPVKQLFMVASAVLLLFLSCGARQQASLWKTSHTVFLHALNLDPENVVALTNLGLALNVESQYGPALKVLERAVALAPNEFEPQYILGLVLGRSGQCERAMVHLRKAMEIRPDDDKTMVNMGINLAKTGKIEESLKYFRRAITINPRNPKAHFNYGVALSLLNKNREASQQVAEALALYPDYEQALKLQQRLQHVR